MVESCVKPINKNIKITNVPLFKIQWTEEDVNAINKVIRRGSSWACGPEIEQFEQQMLKYVGTKYAVAFNSGTSALHAMLLAYNIKQGDEVIVPSFTFIATANAVKAVGATPIFAEIESTSYGLDIDSIKEKISTKTKAIMPIHYAGGICFDINSIKELCQEKKILLFEDSAQSLGASLRGQKAGTFGDSAIFSFCQDKIIPIGEGGMVVTNNEDIYKKLKLICSHGRQETGQNYFSSTDCFDYTTLGYNWRMSSMQAALGLSQFERIEQTIKARQNIASIYQEQLLKQHLDKKMFWLYTSSNQYNHVCQKFTIRLRNGSRDLLQKYLLQKGIQTRAYFGLPVHLTSYYKSLGWKEGDLPKTEDLSMRVLSLPIYPDMTKEEVKFVTDNIRESNLWI